MRLTKNIQGAKKPRIGGPSDFGTTYYRATEKQIKDAFHNDKDANIWVTALIDRDGLDALDFHDSLFGSKVIGDTLYICKTDGSDISVDGENVDPETALDDYSEDELSDYIEDADDKTIIKSITEYELNFKDVEQLAIELLTQNYAFSELYDAANEIDLTSRTR